MSKYNLIAVGDVTKDVFIEIEEASLNCQINKEACSLCFNYAEKIPVKDVVQVPAAGNAANAAMGTCRLGHTSALVSWLGDDRDGLELCKALDCAKIERKFVMFKKERRTNYSTVLNYEGERTILVFRDQCSYKFPKKLPISDWIYYTAVGEKHQTLEKSLLRHLRAHSKIKLLFNPGVSHLRCGIKLLRPVLQRTEVLILNKEEAQLLLMESETHPVRSLLGRLQKAGPETVVITDGMNGSWAISGNALWHIPIIPGNAKERTGAGDAFATGFVNALIAGKDVPTAMRWGNANSWSVVMKIGPQEGLLTKTKMQALLKKYARIKPKKIKKP